MSGRVKLFSVTLKDCVVQTFSVGGAVGLGQDERSQRQNKVAAFRRMAQTPRFREWAREKADQMQTGCDIESVVDAWMAPENLLVEVYNVNEKRWERMYL